MREWIFSLKPPPSIKLKGNHFWHQDISQKISPKQGSLSETKPISPMGQVDLPIFGLHIWYAPEI